MRVITNNSPLVNFYGKEKLAIFLRGLFKNIISGEVDADKMDYLLRDAYFTGCTYGLYNYEHLIKNLCVGFSSTDSWFGIALKKKGLGALEDFVYSRFKMYLQVYNHKTSVGLKWLLIKALSEVTASTAVYNKIFKALKNNDVILLTDTYFWELLKSYAKKDKHSACFMVINRVKLEHIGSKENVAHFEKVAEKLKLPVKPHMSIIWDEASSRFSNITTSFERIRLLNFDKLTKRHSLEAIGSVTDFFSKFKDSQVAHFYYVPSPLVGD